VLLTTIRIVPNTPEFLSKIADEIAELRLLANVPGFPRFKFRADGEAFICLASEGRFTHSMPGDLPVALNHSNR
jgi:hypothetical protein